MTALMMDELSPVALSERELRRQIDRTVSRALVDQEFAKHLLADPTIALDHRGCTPQQYLELRSIDAGNVTDFARQAMALFWSDARYPRFQEEQLTLAAAAI
jgi:hypothetical protein